MFDIGGNVWGCNYHRPDSGCCRHIRSVVQIQTYSLLHLLLMNHLVSALPSSSNVGDEQCHLWLGCIYVPRPTMDPSANHEFSGRYWHIMLLWHGTRCVLCAYSGVWGQHAWQTEFQKGDDDIAWLHARFHFVLWGVGPGFIDHGGTIPRIDICDG